MKKIVLFLLFGILFVIPGEVSARTWTINALPVCPAGQVPTVQYRAYWEVWPASHNAWPNTLQWKYASFISTGPSQVIVNDTGADSASSGIYVGVTTGNGVKLSGIENPNIPEDQLDETWIGWNPATPMFRFTISKLPEGTYTFQYTMPTNLCAAPVPTSAPVARATNTNTPLPSNTPTLTPTRAPTALPSATTIPPSVTPDCSLNPKGDANCSRTIDATDYVIWRTEYVKAAPSISTLNDPDFNNDNKVNLVDLEIWTRSMTDGVMAPTGAQPSTAASPSAGLSPTSSTANGVDLRVENITRDNLYYKVQVCNRGTVAATGKFAVKVENDGFPTKKEYSTNALFDVPAAGQCVETGGITCGLTANASCIDFTNITATADPANVIVEINETNNTFTKQFDGEK